MRSFTPAFFAVSLIAQVAAGSAQATEIVIGTGEFPPYKTESAADQGCVINIVRSAYEAEGWAVDFQFLPWPRNLALLSRGEIDASAYWLERPDRREEYIFPKEPVTVETYNFIFPRNAIVSWDTYEDLRNKRIVTNSSYTYSEEFYRALKDFDIENVVVAAEDQNFGMILRGRADFTIMNEKVFQKYFVELSSEEKSQLHLDPKTALEVRGFLIFSRSDSEKARQLAEIFDRGYQKIRGREDLQEALSICGF